MDVSASVCIGCIGRWIVDAFIRLRVHHAGLSTDALSGFSVERVAIRTVKGTQIARKRCLVQYVRVWTVALGCTSIDWSPYLAVQALTALSG